MIILFRTVREVMRADALCRINGIETTVIPVPEKISGQCGMCLRVEDSWAVKLTDILSDNNFEFTVYEQ